MAVAASNTRSITRIVAGRGWSKGASGVTVQLDSTFIDGAYVGELIEATGQVTKAGKSLIFVRGQINTGERLLMTFSGVIRKFTPRP